MEGGREGRRDGGTEGGRERRGADRRLDGRRLDADRLPARAAGPHDGASRRLGALSSAIGGDGREPAAKGVNGERRERGGCRAPLGFRHENNDGPGGWRRRNAAKTPPCCNEIHLSR